MTTKNLKDTIVINNAYVRENMDRELVATSKKPRAAHNAERHPILNGKTPQQALDLKPRLVVMADLVYDLKCGFLTFK